MIRRSLGVAMLVGLCGCRAERPTERCEAVVQLGSADGERVSMSPGRTITVLGDAEILTAPDRFVLTVGFDLQAETLEAARDGSRERAADLVAVAVRHGVDAEDVQTEQLSLSPRFEDYNHPGRRIVGYHAARSLTLTLRSIEAVEPMLFDMLAAGANRVDRVVFKSSVEAEKRDEARLLAIAAARTKAEALAGALEQSIGEPVRIEEVGARPFWQPQTSNVMLSNETVSQVSDTLASGKLRVHAGVSVVFTLHAA
jgi:uncharacterized protein